MQRIIVFSDLDGTLLDPLKYSFEEALPALAQLRERGIPLILCSSKTRAEMTVYRQRMDNRHPFISENGGGIFIPSGYFAAPVAEAETLDDSQLVTLGTPHAEIWRHFTALRERLGVKVRGFTDMTVEEVAELTGLGREEAALAKQRDFDEPFVFDGVPDAGFLRAIEDAGLNWTQGRIFHIMGRHDKGRAVRLLKALYEQDRGAVATIGLGDGYNDLPMLQSVDQAVLVRHEDGNFDARVDIAALMKTQSPGPLGWNEALLQLLARGENQA